MTAPTPRSSVASSAGASRPEYKQRVLAQADKAKEESGGIGALLRREGLYSSAHLRRGLPHKQEGFNTQSRFVRPWQRYCDLPLATDGNTSGAGPTLTCTRCVCILPVQDH